MHARTLPESGKHANQRFEGLTEAGGTLVSGMQT
jgi:hypothetical protein